VKLLEKDVGARPLEPAGQLITLSAEQSRHAIQKAVLATFARIVATPSGASALSAAAEHASSISVDSWTAGKWTAAQNSLVTLSSLLEQGAVERLASTLSDVVRLDTRSTCQMPAGSFEKHRLQSHPYR